MSKKILYYTLLVCFLCCKHNESENDLDKLKYKLTSDIYHGKEVIDPFRAMENMDDTLVLNWYKEQSKISNHTLENIEGREKLLERIKNKDSASNVYSIKVTYDNRYFYLKKNFTDKAAKLYTRDGYTGEEKLLYNPDEYKPLVNQKFYINYINPSWDGKHIAISLSKNDEEISDIIVLNTQNKTIEAYGIKNSWASELGGIRWLPDNSGFFYEHIPIIDKSSEDYIKNIETVLYRLDEDSRNLNVYFSRKNNPEINMNPEDFPEVTIKNGYDKYAFSNVSGASAYYDYYYTLVENLKNSEINWMPLFKRKDKIKSFVVDNDQMIFLTSKGASNFKICSTSLIDLDIRTPKTLVEEDSNATITDFTVTKHGLYFVKTKNGVEAKLYILKDGESQEISIPNSVGFINLISNGPKYNDLWIETKGWTSDKMRYRYDSINKTFVEESFSSKKKTSRFDFKNIVVEEIEVKSYDGTLIPMSIVYDKNLKFDSNNRALMTGYGAYGFSEIPKKDEFLINWLKEGGMYVITHVRGGGEKGDAWHKGGFKTTKPNTWKDFIACTEYLINKKYTTSNKIAVWSASAGGILIGRAITERPDLYAAAIIRVGKLNTVRSENTPNGLNGVKEYGTVKDSIEFGALLEMDAYHSVKKGEKYPAVLLTAGMNDTRVPAWQPAKFAARMQEATSSKKPILLNIDFNSGHGFDASLEKKQIELADILSFALWQTGHPNYQLNVKALKEK